MDLKSILQRASEPSSITLIVMQRLGDGENGTECYLSSNPLQHVEDGLSWPGYSELSSRGLDHICRN